MLRDRDGGLWIGTFKHGVSYMYTREGQMSFAEPDGLSGEDIYSLFEDREGNIWVATANGLDRFRDFAIATFSVNQGLSSDIVGSVFADRDGSVWLATYGGLNRWIKNRLRFRHSQWTGSTNASATSGSDKRDAKPSGFVPHSLFQDERGRIWVSTAFGFGYLDNDRFISVSGVPGGNVLSMAQDTAGNLWIANEHVGLFQLVREVWSNKFPGPGLGHNDHASAMTADTLQGGLWLGFFLAASPITATVRSERRTQPPTGWAGPCERPATRSGRHALDCDRRWGQPVKEWTICHVDQRERIAMRSVHWVREDDAGSFWLYTPCGLLRVARSELDAWAAAVDHDINAKPTVHATVFDISDGVRILATANHFTPQVAKSTDGKLWFLSGGGVSVVDPQSSSFQQPPAAGAYRTVRRGSQNL